MKNFIVLFREPDGRTDSHSPEDMSAHRKNWDNWFAGYGSKGNLAGGSALMLNGNIITADQKIKNDIHKVGTEIIGGFLLLKANDLQEATQIAASCPIYEFGGYAEVREFQEQLTVKI